MPPVARAQGQVCAQHPTTANPTRQQGLSNGGNPFQDPPHPPPERPNLTEKFLGRELELTKARTLENWSGANLDMRAGIVGGVRGIFMG